ncbi:hypothetical protein TrLO_g9452 [Triparma laevis f. longispina]|uniref:N-acetyltransferase domain-containing protein n=1 Tax=Triparma laevis f. longispina TaxID=1714387 RepID=A0A9W7AW84_9STRA|nr:hypothetical protein TrLO_g9452 [Triparma laevis f. longispina]
MIPCLLLLLFLPLTISLKITLHPLPPCTTPFLLKPLLNLIPPQPLNTLSPLLKTLYSNKIELRLYSQNQYVAKLGITLTPKPGYGVGGLCAILCMYVEEDRRGVIWEGKSYGELLLDISYAINENIILTTDDNGSGGLIRWYEKQGFEIVDEDDGGSRRMVKTNCRGGEWKVDEFY